MLCKYYPLTRDAARREKGARWRRISRACIGKRIRNNTHTHTRASEKEAKERSDKLASALLAAVTALLITRYNFQSHDGGVGLWRPLIQVKISFGPAHTHTHTQPPLYNIPQRARLQRKICFCWVRLAFGASSLMKLSLGEKSPIHTYTLCALYNPKGIYNICEPFSFGLVVLILAIAKSSRPSHRFCYIYNIHLIISLSLGVYRGSSIYRRERESRWLSGGT